MKNKEGVALYRKYRPEKFKDVIGQDQVVKVLEGAVKLGNVSHAYLFAGSRGTGKTSVARILAKEIGTSANDLYEIDAASNRGIDDVRSIRDAVGTLPFESKYKVYIVDEVHMLTKEAFNALLKTLEEPPPYVVFILATTEMEKLPETVISRCETHLFKKPNQLILKEMVAAIAKKEGFTLKPSSAELIALLADGSFRDCQGILQKVTSSSSDKKISAEEVEKVTGAPRGGLVNDFIFAIAEKNTEKGLLAVRQAAENNVDMKVFAKLILQKLRFILLIRFSAGMDDLIKNEVSEEDWKLLRDLAAKKESNISSQTIVAMLDAYDSIGRAYIPELPLELALVKLTSANA